MCFRLLTAAFVSLWAGACQRATPETSAVKQPAKALATSQRLADKPALLTWDDLKLPYDDRFDPRDLSNVAKKLQGRRVKITGVMHGGVESATANSQFLLLRYRPNRFGPGGPIDILMKVTLASGRTVAYFDDPIEVTGILRVDPILGEDNSIWCVYHVDDARVSRAANFIDRAAATTIPAQR